MRIPNKLFAIAAALSVTLTVLAGCAHTPGQYDTLCVDPTTQQRVDYNLCTVNPLWVYYVPYGYTAPAVGVRVNNYTVNNTVNHFHVPAGATVEKDGAPKAGGKVAAPPAKAPAKVNLQKPAAPKAPAVRVGSAPVHVSTGGHR